MAIKDNFQNPKGFIGSMMLTMMNLGHSPMANWAFTQFTLPQKAEIVDIGCGGGRNIKRLLVTCPEGHVYGVDISEESVKKSRAVNKKHLGKRCKIFQGGVDKLPFKAGYMDIATAFETVYFWPDLSENFKEVFRILKPGGRFIVVNDCGDPDKHWDEKIPGMTSYTADQIKEYMEGAGFTDITASSHKTIYCVIGKVPCV